MGTKPQADSGPSAGGPSNDAPTSSSPTLPIERWLHRVAAQVPGALYLFRRGPDGRGSFPYVSEGIRDIYGLDPWELRHDDQSLWARIVPEDHGRIRASVARSAATLRPWRHEYRVAVPGRGERWLRGEATPERQPDGAVLWHGYVTDVTREKRRSDELRRLSRRLELLTRGAGVGVWEWPLSGSEVELDDAMYQVLGWDPAGAPYRMQKLARCVHPEDLAGLEASRDALLSSGEPREVELRVVREDDGRTRWIRGRAMLLRDAEGRPDRVIGTAEDVTVRREAESAARDGERRLALAVDATGQGVWDWHLATNEVRHNMRWCELLGLDASFLTHSLDEFAGHLHPDDAADVMARVQAALDRDVPYVSEHRVIRADGTAIWVEDRGAVIERAPDGAPLRMLGSIRDVGERRRMVDALRAAKDAAERASLAKSTFLANMSHEIRTPMNGVLGAAELLRLSDLDDEQAELIDTVARSSASLLDVINDILDFSRVEAGRLALEHAPFDLRETVAASLSPFLAQARTGPVALESAVDPAVHPYRRGDAARLRQVLVNLVGNALKFTAEGSVRVTARAGAGDEVTLRVEDTGIGIPDDRLATLFDPFEQVDASTSRRFGGTGLGLAICLRFVEAMGGTLGVDSRVGEGSTFWIRLPLGRIDALPRRTSAPPPPSLRAGGEPGLRVLVAEDNPINQRIAERMLSRLGARVEVVPDGAAAVERVRAAPPDLVLMDVQMPGMDGYEATTRIRADEAASGLRTRIVALTANAMPADRARALAVDMDDHIPKPLRLDDLRRLLAAVAAGAP